MFQLLIQKSFVKQGTLTRLEGYLFNWCPGIRQHYAGDKPLSGGCKYDITADNFFLGDASVQCYAADKRCKRFYVVEMTQRNNVVMDLLSNCLLFLPLKKLP